MASSNNGTTDLTWINFCHSGIQRATTAAAATTPTSTWTTTTARACPAAPARTSSSILETWRIAIRQRGSAAPSPRSPTTACVVERRTRPLISSGRLMVWISIKLSCYSNRCRYFTDEVKVTSKDCAYFISKATISIGLAWQVYRNSKIANINFLVRMSKEWSIFTFWTNRCPHFLYPLVAPAVRYNH